MTSSNQYIVVTNKETGKRMTKARFVWMENTKEVLSNKDQIFHLDNNPHNDDFNNLYKAPRGIGPILARRGGLTNDPDLNRIRLKECELIYWINKKCGENGISTLRNERQKEYRKRYIKENWEKVKKWKCNQSTDERRKRNREWMREYRRRKKARLSGLSGDSMQEITSTPDKVTS